MYFHIKQILSFKTGVFKLCQAVKPVRQNNVFLESLIKRQNFSNRKLAVSFFPLLLLNPINFEKKACFKSFSFWEIFWKIEL